MSYYDIAMTVKHHGEKNDYYQRMMALHACWIVNLWSKKKMTPDKLLGKKKKYSNNQEHSDELDRKLREAAGEEQAQKLDLNPARFKNAEEMNAFIAARAEAHAQKIKSQKAGKQGVKSAE